MPWVNREFKSSRRRSRVSIRTRSPCASSGCATARSEASSPAPSIRLDPSGPTDCVSHSVPLGSARAGQWENSGEECSSKSRERSKALL
eukprot:scaffold136838_cov33-Tisochrysis_lutea.AAC.1